MDLRTELAVQLLDMDPAFNHTPPPPWSDLTEGAQAYWLRRADAALAIVRRHANTDTTEDDYRTDGS